MKSELDQILDRLPRTGKKLEAPAIVFVNASGDLVIALDGGGILTLPENQLGYLRADAEFEIPR
jgi:hypothetical protein